jgi:hypothetical protein
MPLARFIMVLLLSCLCVQGAVYRITGTGVNAVGGMIEAAVTEAYGE